MSIDMLILIAVVGVLALAFVAASRGLIPLPEGGHWIRRERTPREVGEGFMVLLREPVVLAVAVGLIVGLVARSFGVATPGPIGLVIAIVMATVALQVADLDRRRALYAWAAAMALASVITVPMIRPPVAATVPAPGPVAPAQLGVTAPVATPAPTPAPGVARPATPTPAPPLPEQRIVVRDEWVALGGTMIHSWTHSRVADLVVERFTVERTTAATTLVTRVIPLTDHGIRWFVIRDETHLALPDGTWLGLRDATGVGLARWRRGGGGAEVVKPAPRSLGGTPMSIRLVFPPIPAAAAAATEADVLLRWWCEAEAGWSCAAGPGEQRRARIQMPPAPGVTPTPAPGAPQP
jgi:hypothetical protein